MKIFSNYTKKGEIDCEIYDSEEVEINPEHVDINAIVKEYVETGLFRPVFNAHMGSYDSDMYGDEIEEETPILDYTLHDIQAMNDILEERAKEKLDIQKRTSKIEEKVNTVEKTESL